MRSVVPSTVSVVKCDGCASSQSGEPAAEDMAKRPAVEPKTELGCRILAARDELGITQNELERQAGLKGKGAISHWNKGTRGQRVAITTTFALPRALGVRAEWLWLGRGAKREAPGGSTQEKAAETALRRGVLQIDIARVDERVGERSHPFDWWVQEYMAESIGRTAREAEEKRSSEEKRHRSGIRRK